MSSDYLTSLKPGVLRQLATQNRKRLWAKDPGRWAREVLDERLWSKQIEIAESVRDHYGTAVAAGHSVGKSRVAGVIALWWIHTHPVGETDTFVATTAPSQPQVDLIWSYIRTFHRKLSARYEAGEIDVAPIGRILTENVWRLDNGDTIGQGRKPPDKDIDIAFQGRHATYLLAITDEAVGVPAEMMSAMATIATGQHNRQLMLANPTDPTSAMHKLWPNARGEGGDPNWNRIHISMFDSPLVTHEPGFDTSRAEGLADMSTIENLKRLYGGEDDPRYIARVLGQWPSVGGNGLFTEDVIARAMRVCVVPHSDAEVFFGVDVARFGGDLTTVYMAELGEVFETDDFGEPTVGAGRQGLRVRKIGSWSKAPITSTDPDNLGTVQRVDQLAKEYGADVINVDASGLGGGVIDGLVDIEGRRYEVFEVYGGSTQNVDRRAFINLRAEQYAELKRRMAEGEIDLDPADELLFDELRGIRMQFTNDNAMKIESKDDMKKRGAKSPDHADAVWYAVLDLGAALAPDPGTVVVADIDEVADGVGSFYDSARGFARFGW